MFALSSSLRIPDPYVHFKNPRPLSPPWGPQTYQPAQELTLSKAWQPTPVFLPGESHGQRSLTDCSPLGCREPDMTEATQHTGMHVQALPQGRTKSKAWETSLTFHWLGHCNSNAWGTGSVPGWEMEIPHAMQQKKKFEEQKSQEGTLARNTRKHFPKGSSAGDTVNLLEKSCVSHLWRYVSGPWLKIWWKLKYGRFM